MYKEVIYKTLGYKYDLVLIKCFRNFYYIMHLDEIIIPPHNILLYIGLIRSCQSVVKLQLILVFRDKHDFVHSLFR